jgi:hypothetical protein
MLKLEPREGGRIVFPSPAAITTAHDGELEEAIGTMQRWRHYAD